MAPPGNFFQRGNPAKARPRQETGVMNQTESRYADVLEGKRLAGEIVAWQYDAIKVRIGVERCWLTVDFLVQRADGQLELIDVKGSGPIEEDARVKLHAAAQQFPLFHWVIAKERGYKKGFEEIHVPKVKPVKKKASKKK